MTILEAMLDQDEGRAMPSKCYADEQEGDVIAYAIGHAIQGGRCLFDPSGDLPRIVLESGLPPGIGPLTGEHFHNQVFGRVWDAAVSELSEGRPVSRSGIDIAIGEQMKDPIFAQQIYDAIESVPSGSLTQANYAVTRVFEASMNRRIHEAAQRLINERVGPGESYPSLEVLNEADRMRRFLGRTETEMHFESELGEIKEVPWLLEPMIPSEGIVSIFGPSGVGKSFLALDLALAIQNGVVSEATGTAPLEPRQVLYIANEGKSGLDSRTAAWRHHRGLLGLDSDILFDTSATTMSSQDDVNQIVMRAFRKGVHPRVVVFDTLSRVFVGNENAAEDMNRFLQLLDVLRERLNAVVVLIHHTGVVDKTRERGSSAYRAAVDVSIGLEDAGHGSVKVTNWKTKESIAFPPIYFRLKPVRIPHVVNSCVISTLSNVGA